MNPALGEGFSWIASVSLKATLLILLILLARVLLRRWLNPRAISWLWLLVIVRLLVPWTPESPLSLYNLYAMDQSGGNSTSTDQVPQKGSFVTQPGTEEVKGLPEAKTSTLSAQESRDFAAKATEPDKAAKNGIEKLPEAIPRLWLAGVGFMLSLFAIPSLRFASRVRITSAAPSERVLEISRACAQEMRIRRSFAVMETDAVTGPALFGIVKPKILLPRVAGSLRDEELRHLFLHELAHLKRKDLMINGIFSFLVAVHWFNPLLWYAYRKMREDQELACDSLVLSTIGSEQSQSYGNTIIRLLETMNTPVRYAGSAGGISGGKKELRRRLKRIASAETKAYKLSVLGMVVVLVLGGCAMTKAVTGSASSGANPAPSALIPTADAGQSAAPAATAQADKPSGPLAIVKEISLFAPSGAKGDVYKGLTVSYGNTTKSFPWITVTNPTYAPEIHAFTLTGNGEEQAAIILTEGYGTGIIQQTLHVLQFPDFRELTIENSLDAIRREVSIAIMKRSEKVYLSASSSGKQWGRVYPEAVAGHWSEGISFGSRVKYTVEGNRIQALAEGAASPGDFPVQAIAEYGSDLLVKQVLVVPFAIESSLDEATTKRLMAERMGTEGWTFAMKDDQYSFTSHPQETDVQGMTYRVNPITGTVYDETSGGPQTNLLIENAPNLKDITSGTAYLEKLKSLSLPFLSDFGLTPVGEDWLGGGYGDGYLYGTVKKDGETIEIKFDVFTQEWEALPR
ncbi:M56 family metallopeptidase [Gorillibacterium timonense]|uniref:M56 family metallopeptidase n=1 Tax=Gorillibacterium timonense TaxID=1689269 RepID=UPI00071DA9DB|nr:M56 family metallopeptidase [Gorillibacterium timonense]